MPMLPQLNQTSQGLNPQLPQVPSTQQARATTSSVTTPGMGSRPFSHMAPDNGQHGGAPRYMTPSSGARSQSVASAMPSPSQAPPTYQRGLQSAQASQMQNYNYTMRGNTAPAAPTSTRAGANFDPQRVINTARAMQDAMPFNRALQERFLSMHRGEAQPSVAMQENQPLPPMFYR